MKRAMLTLLAVGIILPLASEIARAGGRRGHRDHEKKGVSVTAGPGGLTIGYTHVKHRGSRHHGHRRGLGVTFRLGRPHKVVLKRWVPGHHVIEERHVRQPDRIEKVWVPDRYVIRRDACGRPYRVLVEEGHWVKRVIPGRIVVERVKVWVPGHWERV
jgi:hypothetical protein